MAILSTPEVKTKVYTHLKEEPNYKPQLFVLTFLFFTWAFVTNLNDILIPHLRKALDLTDFESAFVQTAFFLSYFVISVPTGLVINKIGYKKGLIVGLLLMFVGSLLFVPAATTQIYAVFLIALFVLASGVAVLQVAANAYVVVLGTPETASRRLNFTQAWNSMGAAMGPLVFGSLIFKEDTLTDAQIAALSPNNLQLYRIQEANAVIMPYLGLAAILFILVAMIYFTRLPEIDAELEQSKETESIGGTHSIWAYSHLLWGCVAMFFFVGAEVSIGSFIVRFAGMPEIGGMKEIEAKNFVAAYKGLEMVGRFLGFWLLLKVKPQRLILANALFSIVALAVAINWVHPVSLYLVVMVGLFNSIQFPTIFTLAIKDIGKHTKKGSSFLVMAIVGGAIMPLFTGLMSDASGIQSAFLVPLLCYLPIAYFGWKGYAYKMPILKMRQ